MRFSPIHQDNIIRAIYGALVLSSFVLMSLGTGIVHTIFMCISVVKQRAFTHNLACRLHSLYAQSFRTTLAPYVLPRLLARS